MSSLGGVDDNVNIGGMHMKRLKESAVFRFLRYVMDWTAHRDTIKTLDILTDKELNDIGLSRGGISDLIYRSQTSRN
jgi:uncharacterized protein YjiS (DUF1127 family)